MRLCELAASRVRFGYRRLTVILRREGWRVNPKRIYRLYSEDGLTVRTKVRKKLARRSRVPTPRATRPNQKWSMDFIDRGSARRLVPLGFLSPRLVEAIVESHQPPDLGVMALTRRIDIPLLWSAQEQALGVR